MPRHDAACAVPAPHPPHPSGIGRQPDAPWCPGTPDRPGAAPAGTPVTAERAELLALAVVTAAMEQLTTAERRRCLDHLNTRFGPEHIGEWVLAACGHLWPERHPPGTTLDPTAPRVCPRGCTPDHPAAVAASPRGVAIVPVTYHHQRPEGGST